MRANTLSRRRPKYPKYSSSITCFGVVVCLPLSVFAAELLEPSTVIRHVEAVVTAPPHPDLVWNRLHPRQASIPLDRLACSALSSIYSVCSSSGLADLSGPSALASCACYYEQSWVPNIFDGLATNCYNYVRSIQPDAVGGIAPYLNLCFTAGDVSSAFTEGSKACGRIANTLMACASRTIIIDDLNFSGSSSLANCVCYGPSSVYAPNSFDALASVCSSFAQNQPGQNPDISNLAGLCRRVGDVRSSASESLQDCRVFENQLAICQTNYSGTFDTLNSNQQASCLCYGASKSWSPEFIDAKVSNCVGYLKTADLERMVHFEPFLGFCQSLGDVRATTSTESATPGRTTSLVGLTITERTTSSTATSLFVPGETGSEGILPTPSPDDNSASPRVQSRPDLIFVFATVISVYLSFEFL